MAHELKLTAGAPLHVSVLLLPSTKTLTVTITVTTKVCKKCMEEKDAKRLSF